MGYDEAKTGETFVRIGVGAVRKPDEPAYRRFATYEIVDPGRWKVSTGKDRVTYVHELRDANGYGTSTRRCCGWQRTRSSSSIG